MFCLKIVLFIIKTYALQGALSHFSDPIRYPPKNLIKELNGNSNISLAAGTLETLQTSAPINIFDFTSSEKNHSSKCWQDWSKIIIYEKWKIPKFWDSFGVVGTGILEGSTTFLGQPEECINVKRGVFPVTYDTFPDTKPFLVYYKLDPSFAYVMRVGVCMPAECSSEDVMEIYKEFKNPNVSEPPFVVLAMEQPDVDTSSPGFIISWIVFSVLFFMVFVGTATGISREAFRELSCFLLISGNYRVLY